MAAVVVTGGTGTLGRALVPLLCTAGHEVRVLSRQAAPAVPPGVDTARGDIRTGEGIPAAVAAADVVIHAASNPRRHVRETEVEGARYVAAAARKAGAHVIYVSIVGVDRHRYPYYRAKRAAELVVEESGAPWSVLRATQFHDLIDYFLARALFIRTPHLRFQPVEVAEVAQELAAMVIRPPVGRAPDFGGPEVLTIQELAETRRLATGARTRLVRVPAMGFLADFDAGRHLTPEHRVGTRTWGEWLAGSR